MLRYIFFSSFLNSLTLFGHCNSCSRTCCTFFLFKQLGQQYRGLIFVSCSEITFNANVVKFILVSYKLADPANITNLLPVPISDGISLSVNSYQAIIKSVSICHCLRWHSLQCYSLKSFVVKSIHKSGTQNILKSIYYELHKTKNRWPG